MTVKAVPIIGYQPDLAQDTPGVLVQTSQVLPTDRGVGNGWGLASASSAFLGNTFGGFESVNIAGTMRPFIGTTTKIYELVGATPTDVSGSAYHAASGQRWSFAQYGNTCLAVNKGDRLQKSASGAFSDAFADAPKASVVIVAGPSTRPFAILFDYDDGTDTPHGIYWNPDPTLTWATSVATQVGNIAVVDVNGRFTAAVPYRDGAIAFKAGAMYEGRYLGNADMWVWTRISSGIGCIGPGAVCLANDVIFFADRNGLWQYDGSYPKPIPGAVHRWFATNNGGSDNVQLHWDPAYHVLWVRYNDDGFGGGMFMAFNPRSNLWTHYQSIVGGYFDNLNLGVAYLIGSTYAAALEASGTRFAAFQKSGNSASAATIQANIIGAEYGMVKIGSVRPHWLAGAADTTANWCACDIAHGPTLRNIGNSLYACSSDTPGRFSGVVTARFVQPRLSVVARQPFELDSIATDGEVMGKE